MAGREISAPECGESRMSRYACPVDCPFNPWRPEAYDEVMAIHDRLDARVYPRLERDARDTGRPLDPPHELNEALQDYFIDRLFQSRDAAGHTFYERWEARGLDGLSNDERVLFRAHARLRVRAIEIRTVRDETLSEATDLFDPAAPAIPIADRSLADIAGRFYPFLAWMYDLPHYWRMHGVAVTIPEVQGLTPAEVVRGVAAHLGWSADAEPLDAWLARHFARCADALQAVPAVLWEETARNSNLVRTVVLYRLRAPSEEFTRWMDAWPEVDRTDTEPALAERGFGPSWDWLDDPARLPMGHVTAPAGTPMRGTFSLGVPQLLLTIPMGQAVEPVRADFEARAGDRVEFVGARADDLGRQTEKVRSVTPEQRALVPPAFLTHARRLDVRLSRLPLPAGGAVDPRQLMREMEKRWLDDAVPGLGGLTPRQAARDPAQRPALLEMVKDRIRSTDARQRSEGGEQDPIWLAHELGLAELDVPAPAGLYSPPRPILPDLLDHPLTVQEVETRLDLILGDDQRILSLPDLLEAEAPTVCEFLAEIFSEDEVREENILFDLSTMAWLILFPRQPPAHLPETGTLRAAMARRLRAATQVPAGDDRFLHVLADSRRQPTLAAGLQQLAGEALDRSQLKVKRSAQAMMRIAGALAVLVDELDALARPSA